MLGPLVILPLLSICGGWMASSAGQLDGHGALRRLIWRPPWACEAAQAGSAHLELMLSIAAVAVALTGLAGWPTCIYRKKPTRPAQLAAALPGGYKLLANKYYVDEFYGATVVKPLLGISRYLLGWFVDKALLGGMAWLLGRHGHVHGGAAAAAGSRATFALMPRGWRQARRRCSCLCWSRGQRCWPASLEFVLKVAGH